METVFFLCFCSVCFLSSLSLSFATTAHNSVEGKSRGEKLTTSIKKVEEGFQGPFPRKNISIFASLSRQKRERRERGEKANRAETQEKHIFHLSTQTSVTRLCGFPQNLRILKIPCGFLNPNCGIRKIAVFLNFEIYYIRFLILCSFLSKKTFLINLVDLCGFCGFFLKILRDFAQTFWSH